MLLRAGFSLATVYFLGALVRSPIQLFVVRLLQGFATGFVPAALAIVSSSVPEEKMGSSLGFMQNAVLTGTIIGPLFGGILAHIFGIRVSFVVASLIMFLGTILVKVVVAEPQPMASTRPEHELENATEMSVFKLALSNKAFLEMLLLLLLGQMGIMALQPLVTLRVAELHGQLAGSDLSAGIVFGVTGVAGALAAPLWGRVGQKVGFIKILITAFAGAGVVNGFVLISRDIWTFTMVQFLFGAFAAGINPAVNTIAVINTDANFRGRVFGFMMSANQMGSMLGPLLGGIFSTWVGVKPVFLLTGIGLFAVAWVLWERHIAKDILVPDKQI